MPTRDEDLRLSVSAAAVVGIVADLVARLALGVRQTATLSLASGCAVLVALAVRRMGRAAGRSRT